MRPFSSAMLLGATLLVFAAGCDPTPETYSLEGHRLYQAGEFRQATAAFENAARLEPQNATHHFNMAASLEANGQIDEAIHAYWMATRLDPGLVEAHVNMARCWIALGNHDRAIEA